MFGYSAAQPQLDSIDYVPGQAETLCVLCSLSSVIAKSGHTFFLPSPVARSVFVTGSGSIAHQVFDYVVYIIYGKAVITWPIL
jgi:hypothetical protein